MENKRLIKTIFAIILTIGIIALLASLFVPKKTFDIAWHDTYYVFSVSIIILLGILILTFITSLVIGIISKFTNKTANWLLLVSLALLILFMKRFGFI
jgi:hypothetical protein